MFGENYMSQNESFIGIDFDGTLAYYYDYHEPHMLGNPIMPMIESVKRLLSRGVRVKIFTARVAGDDDYAAISRRKIENWCLTNIGEVLPVTAVKDYRMIELWDDRAVQVIHNTGVPIQNALMEAAILLTNTLQQGDVVPAGLRADIENFIDTYKQEFKNR
jgi:hypothetical protein